VGVGDGCGRKSDGSFQESTYRAIEPAILHFCRKVLFSNGLLNNLSKGAAKAVR
jgi:hypothetical protein